MNKESIKSNENVYVYEKKRNNPMFKFGRYLIDKEKLNDNILSISYAKTGLKLYGFPNIQISKSLKNLILNKVTSNDKLTDDELNYFRKLAKKSKLELSETQTYILSQGKQENDENDNVKSFIYGTLDDVQHRLNILLGEIDAGNNANIVKNEVSEILNFLLKKKVISNELASNITKRYITQA